MIVFLVTVSSECSDGEYLHEENFGVYSTYDKALVRVKDVIAMIEIDGSETFEATYQNTWDSGRRLILIEEKEVDL